MDTIEIQARQQWRSTGSCRNERLHATLKHETVRKMYNLYVIQR